MMNFIENPGLVIIHSVVFDSLPCKVLPQSIHNYDGIEVDQDTASCTTWDVLYSVGLNGYLDLAESCDDRYHHLNSGLCVTI